jgi:hypothetical protein
MENKEYKKLQEMLRTNWTLVDKLLQEALDNSVNIITHSNVPSIIHEERGKLKMINYIRNIVK